MNAPVITTTTSLRRKEMEEIADRIRARIRRTVEDIIETGRDLATVKDSMGFGEFTKWLDREFSMTDRTARNYMRAATWAEGKTEIISDLSPTTLYLLAAPSTPEDIWKEVIADIDAGKPIDEKKIKRRVQEVKEATTTNAAPAAMVEQEEVAQDEPKPEQKTEKSFWESPEYKQRSEFKNDCLLLAVECDAASHWEVPQLNAEWRAALAEIVKKAETALCDLRIKIEEIHAESAPAVEQPDPEDPGDDDDPLAIPEVFKRGRQES